MIKLKGYKIFISSPGDLEEEKKNIKEYIHRFNFLHALKENKIFIPFTSKEVAGGTGRGQELINQKFDGVDFLITMFWKRYGTSTGKYGSGTIEEYEEGKKLKDQGKLIEILVLFKKEMVTDAGPQLEEVRNFKRRIEENNEAYHKTFDGELELSNEINIFLNEGLAKAKDEIVKREEKVIVSELKEPSEI